MNFIVKIFCVPHGFIFQRFSSDFNLWGAVHYVTLVEACMEAVKTSSLDHGHSLTVEPLIWSWIWIFPWNFSFQILYYDILFYIFFKKKLKKSCVILKSECFRSSLWRDWTLNLMFLMIHGSGFCSTFCLPLVKRRCSVVLDYVWFWWDYEWKNRLGWSLPVFNLKKHSYFLCLVADPKCWDLGLDVHLFISNWVPLKMMFKLKSWVFSYVFSFLIMNLFCEYFEWILKRAFQKTWVILEESSLMNSVH